MYDFELKQADLNKLFNFYDFQRTKINKSSRFFDSEMIAAAVKKTKMPKHIADRAYTLWLREIADEMRQIDENFKSKQSGKT